MYYLSNDMFVSLDLTIIIQLILIFSFCGSNEIYPGTSTRPVLSDLEAEILSENKYLEPWVPEKVTIPERPNYVVGKNRSLFNIQTAVNVAILDNINETTRQFIFVEAGLYEETLFVPEGSISLTIYGTADTKIVLNQSADITVADWMKQVNPNGTRYQKNDPAYSMYESCAKKDLEATIGTRCTSVVWLKSRNIQLYNIVIENSAVQAQAVSVRTDNENIQLERVSLLGHQDTVYVASGKVFINNSFISGDIDYVFGGGTAVFNNCTFRTVADRRKIGIIFAPKTACSKRYGFLIENSLITADDEFQNDSKVILGRPWDSIEYIPNNSDNGQILIRNTRIDDIINRTNPWGEGINSKRKFSANIEENRDLNDNNFNRFWEYNNNY